jgi:hypothetical protein
LAGFEAGRALRFAFALALDAICERVYRKGFLSLNFGIFNQLATC